MSSSNQKTDNKKRWQQQQRGAPVIAADMTTRSVTAAEWGTNGVAGLLAAAIHWVASCCTIPISIVLEDGARVGTPIDPGFGFQKSTAAAEKLARAGLVIKIILLLPFCLTVSAVGALLRFITAYWRPRIAFYRRVGTSMGDELTHDNFSTFTILPPLNADVKAPIASPTRSLSPRSNGSLSPRSPVIASPSHILTSIGGDPDVLTMCTYNIALMPHFVCMYNGVRPSLTRAPEILRAILTRNDDIVCIQEAFHTEAARYLVEGLSTQYPYIVFNVAANWMKLGSGLMIASKLPLSRPQYWCHPRCSGTDTFAVKGALAVTVKTRYGPIALFNTHLNAPWGPDWQNVHADQLQSVQDAVEEYTGLPPSTSLTPADTATTIDITSSSSSITSSVAGEAGQTKWLAVLQVGDFNIGPMNWRGGKSEDWNSMAGYFQHINDNYLTSEDEALGTFFDFSYGGVGWRPSECNSWPTVTKRLDHILHWRACGASLPLVTLPNDEFGPDQPKCHGGTARDGPSLRRDHMDGASDHLAVRGAFSLIHTNNSPPHRMMSSSSSSALSLSSSSSNSLSSLASSSSSPLSLSSDDGLQTLSLE